MPPIIKSISYSQRQILEDIQALFTGPIEADLTFGKGGLWAGSLWWPRLCFDLEPRVTGVTQADVRQLPLATGSLASVIFDPPFMVTTGMGAKLKDRFGHIGRNFKELWDFYFLALGEIHRVLRPRGWLIFKCQDCVNSGKNHFSHVEIFNHAESLGFVTKDLFILAARNRMTPKNQQRQVHARKFHAYFWVFRKNGGRNGSAQTPGKRPE